MPAKRTTPYHLSIAKEGVSGKPRLNGPGDGACVPEIRNEDLQLLEAAVGSSSGFTKAQRQKIDDFIFGWRARFQVEQNSMPSIEVLEGVKAFFDAVNVIRAILSPGFEDHELKKLKLNGASSTQLCRAVLSNYLIRENIDIPNFMTNVGRIAHLEKLVLKQLRPDFKSARGRPPRNWTLTCFAAALELEIVPFTGKSVSQIGFSSSEKSSLHRKKHQNGGGAFKEGQQAYGWFPDFVKAALALIPEAPRFDDGTIYGAIRDRDKTLSITRAISNRVEASTVPRKSGRNKTR